jgi:glutathione S-transferase
MSSNGVSLTLVSHTLCPYVQRAAIVLAEKGAPFERRWVDLAHKPDWFKAVSPLGKTPVLLVRDVGTVGDLDTVGDIDTVGEVCIFESAVICEYLDETIAPRLHPADPLARAQHRSWMEFGSALLNTIGGFYSAPDESTLLAKAADMRARFEQLERELQTGPYFSGVDFCVVDAVFGPVFRYFDVFDTIADFACLTGLHKVNAWRAALATRPSVRDAVSSDYPQALRAFLLARRSALSARMTKRPSASQA